MPLVFQKALKHLSLCLCICSVLQFLGWWRRGVRVTPVYHAHFNLFCVFTLGLHSLVDLDNKMILKVINRLNLTNVFSCKFCGLTPFCTTTTVSSAALLPFPLLSQSSFGIPVERTRAHWQRLQESHVPAVHRRLVQPAVPPTCVAGLSRAYHTSGSRRSHCGSPEELCVQELLHASPRSLL